MRASFVFISAALAVFVVGGVATAQTAPSPTAAFPTTPPQPAPPATESAPPPASAPLPTTPPPEPPPATNAPNVPPPLDVAAVASPPARPAPAPLPAAKAPEPAPAPRNWNLGAGIGFGVSNAGPLFGDYLLSTRPLPFRLSLEKSLGETTWLMMNGAFTHVADEIPVTNLIDPTAERRKVERSYNVVVGTLGIRQIVVSGLVDFSVFGGLEAGNAWINGEATTEEEVAIGTDPGSSTVLFGILAGIAVERELIESLSLRIAVDVASMTWLWATTKRIEGDSAEELDIRRSGFELLMVPALELRLYF
jgi:hypothetical protein